MVLLVGCMAEAGDGDLDDGAEYASEMTAAEAARVLALVNYPRADLVTLDVDAALPAQAAKSITAYREGADGVFPSQDDNEIDGLPELDAIPNVGAATLQKLLAYATAHPAPQPVVVGSRRFLGWQAEAILWATNTAPIGVFNGLLDNRAAANIVAARPFATLAALDAVPLVGPSAFDVFKGQSLTWWRAYVNNTPTTPPPPASLAGTYDGITFDEETAVSALAIANERTRDDMVANGVYGSGASAIVANRPYTTLAQVAAVSGVGTSTMRGLHAYATSLLTSGTIADNEECSSHDECQSGLCTALTVSPVGWCRPAWMAGTFTSTADAAIPTGGTITQTLEVTGLASVPEDLTVHLDIAHPRKQDLRVVLTQPSSAESVIWEVDSAGDARIVVGWSLERDSNVNGTWVLSVQDTGTGASGTLSGWSLELTSRWD